MDDVWNFLFGRPEHFGQLSLLYFNSKMAKRQAGVVSSALSLANTILGAGTVALASVFASFGWIGVIPAIALMLAQSIFTLDVLCIAAIEKQKFTFQTLATSVHSKKFGVFIALAVGLFGFGVCLSYTVLLADVLPPVIAKITGMSVGSVWYTDRYVLSIISAAIFFLPLSLLPTLNGLRYASAGTILCVIYIATILVVAFIKSLFGGALFETPEDPVTELFHFSARSWTGLSVLGFAFCCQLNGLTAYKEINDPSEKKMKIVGRIAVGVALVVYTIIGVTGYALYGYDVTGNILANLPADNNFVFVGNAGIALVVICSYPFAMFPFKAEVTSIIEEHLTNKKKLKKESLTDEQDSNVEELGFESEKEREKEQYNDLGQENDLQDISAAEIDNVIDSTPEETHSALASDVESVRRVGSTSQMDSLLEEESTSDEEKGVRMRRRSSAMEIVRKMSDAVKHSGLKVDELSIALDSPEDEPVERVVLPYKYRALLTAAAVTVATALSLLTDSVEAVFGLVGSLLASVSVFIFPPFAYLRCGRKLSDAQRIKSYCAMTLGFVIMFVGTYTSLLGFIGAEV
ncbi:hypothetical protein P9112_012991 [Eukaryota sp. TZLM1-RC]